MWLAFELTHYDVAVQQVSRYAIGIPPPIPFSRVLALCEMQTDPSRIWTRVAESTFYDDNCYTTSASLLKCIKTEFLNLRGEFNRFPDFFVQAFQIVVDSWKFTMLLLYILWDDWPIFMISGSNEQLQQQLEYTLLNPDCHSWWISKMQYGRKDTLEERYAIKICFKLGKKMPQKRMECFRPLFDHLAWIEHQFLSGIRDSRKPGSLWGMMRGVGGVRKSEHQSWLAKGLGLGLLCWGSKGVQEEIPSEEASTLQIGSVAFQFTSTQLPPCHRLFDQDGHQDSSPPSL